MDMPAMVRPRKGRGAASNDSGRFEAERRTPFDDGWGTTDEEPAPLTTTLTVDSTRTIIARNDSPDIGFDRSINPYRGCEHGCIYCYARPSHAFLGLSPGLDFESRLFYKPEAAALLATELKKRGYSCQPIALGSNTDPYQPVERRLRITRSILEVLRDFRHPVTIVSKAALIQRDIDILAEMAKDRLATVTISVTTLELKGLFKEWLEEHFPDKAAHVLSLVAQTHGGRLYDSAWSKRMTGTGPYADMLQLRFNRACRKLGFGQRTTRPLDTRLFRPPPQKGDQLALF